jgi:hypothetical protein
MPCNRFGTPRSILAALATPFFPLMLIGPTAAAQDRPSWSIGAALGLAAPTASWGDDLEAGTEYRLTVTKQRATSPWALQGEIARHAFTFADASLAARQDGSDRGYIRQTSVSLGLRYTLVARSHLETWASSSVALHSVRTSLWRDGPISDPVLLRDEYVPGLSAGLGIALGPFRVQPVAEVRLRLVALRERPLVSIPLSVGVRF